MKQILIAENDMTTRTDLATILQKWGYDPVMVENGNDAWEIMQKPDAPNLAILDWVMPGMDGLDVCRRLRNLNDADPPYIIIQTSMGEKANIVKNLDAGFNDYVSKPYDKDELRARISVGQRVVEMQKEMQNLTHEATHDPLTGALNRRAILNGLCTELARTKRKNSKLSIGLCDIDHFKQINDKYGHQAGDEVLCALIRTIQEALRVYDFVGRYGGEEFLVVAPDSAGLPEEGLYERLRAKIAGLRIPTKPGEICITVSIGVADATGFATADELVATADTALYKAKDNGRNNVVYADSLKE